ncbi:hypothetical protein AC739_10890 [Planococcus glaciei]|nr:hypothetical protein AC739_10890 [Planococcus glaciei]
MPVCKHEKKAARKRQPFESAMYGGIVWESNPPSLARRPLRVLKTQEDTSHPSNPVMFKPSKFITKKREAQGRRLKEAGEGFPENRVPSLETPFGED